GGPIRQRQQSCRRPPSFPCSGRIPRRRLGSELGFERAHLLGGLRELAAKPAWLPDLKLVAETDERNRVADPRMGLQRLGQDHPPLAVHLQSLAGAVERRRELLALLR